MNPNALPETGTIRHTEQNTDRENTFGPAAPSAPSRAKNLLRFLPLAAVGIAVNLLFLAIIGWVNHNDLNESSRTEEWTVHTVELTRNTPSEPEETASRRRPKTEEPAPERTTPDSTSKEKKELPREPVPVRTDGLSLSFNPIQLNVEGVGASIPVRTGPAKKPSQEAGEKKSNEKKSTYRRSELDRLPRRTGGPNPEYPWTARRNGTEGWVRLKLTITRTGSVSSVSVVDWAGSPAFKQAAREAVRNWTFRPGEVDGRAVRTENIFQKISFELSR